MSDQTNYIPFGGIGEIEFNLGRKDQYKCDTREFNADKTLPFIKLLYFRRRKKLSKQNKIGKIRKAPSIGDRHYENSNSIKSFFYQNKKLK